MLISGFEDAVGKLELIRGIHNYHVSISYPLEGHFCICQNARFSRKGTGVVYKLRSATPLFFLMIVRRNESSILGHSITRWDDICLVTRSLDSCIVGDVCSPSGSNNRDLGYLLWWMRLSKEKLRRKTFCDFGPNSPIPLEGCLCNFRDAR